MPVKIDDLLRAATHLGASDLHCKAGSQPFMRIGGELRPVVELAAPHAGRHARHGLLDDVEPAEAALQGGLRGRHRLRRLRAWVASAPTSFSSAAPSAWSLRVIPDKVRTITELGLPPVIERIAEEQRGLILVTGTTGSGKSTTLAAMIDYINTNRGGHIVTIEDPIEFLHRDKKLLRHAARGGRGHALVRRGSARRAPAGPGRHPRRRDARPRDHRDGADRRRDRPPRALDPPHARRDRDHPRASSRPSRRTSRSPSASSSPASCARSSRCASSARPTARGASPPSR